MVIPLIIHALEVARKGLPKMIGIRLASSFHSFSNSIIST